LSKDELRYGLKDYGIELNIREMDDIFTYFDRDRNGFVDVTEFLVGIRGDMNERRKKMVKMAFDILDKDGSGVVTIDELEEVYDVSWNPDVKSGKKTSKEAMKDFMKQWERTDQDGLITFDEFLDYYKEISASIDGDDYFELMIRNAWRIAGGEGFAANTANRRVLVTMKDGSQRVETINKELGLKAGDKEAIRARLAAQGVDASNVDLYGSADNTTKARNAKSAPVFSSKQKQQAKVPANPIPHRTAFERHTAAVKLASAFRGRLARKVALGEKRKMVASEKQRQEELEEQARPKPAQIIRPKGKSYIGF